MSVDPRLRALLVAPLPPPPGGIATATATLRDAASLRCDLSLRVVDTALHWRRITQTGIVPRLAAGPLRAAGILRRLARAIAHERPAVVDIAACGGPAFLQDLFLLRYLRRAGIPTVLSIHMGRLPSLLRRGGAEACIARAAMQAATAVRVLDEPSRLALMAQPGGVRIVKIPNPIDVAAVQRAAADAPDRTSETDVIFVGSVIPSKGVFELVSACASARGIRLTLVGPIEERLAASLRAIAAAGHLSLQVTGAITHEEAYRAIAAAKVLVLPSYAEGLPIVLLEAMALGKPIVATPVGAVPEMLGFGCEEPCGLEVPVRDVATLRDAILELLAQPTERQIMGERGIRRACQRYGTDAVVPQFVGLWRSLQPAGA